MYDLLIPDVSTSWRRVVNFTIQPLYSEERGRGFHWPDGLVNLRTGLDGVERITKHIHFENAELSELWERQIMEFLTF
jgi:hypothetical protein